LATAEIPDDQPMTGSFITLRDEAEAAVQEIITGLDADDPASDAGKVATLYASFMDTDTVEAAGAEPIDPLLSEVNAVSDVDGFIALLGRFARLGVSGLF